MRNPNGYGSIKKLSGKRRRPFGVYITTDFEMTRSTPSISFLKDILSEEVYSSVEKEYNAYIVKQKVTAKQKQTCIGYYATRQEAMIALAEYNKNPYDIDKRNTTFAQIYDIINESKFSKMKKSARVSYSTAYAKCDDIKEMRIKDIKLAHLQAIINANNTLSTSTLNSIIVLFHAVFKFAMENDLINKDYSQFVENTSTATKKKKKPISKDTIKLIWDNIDWVTPQVYSRSRMGNQQMVDSIIIMLYTGMRIGELLTLKKEHVHLEERWIDLHGTKTAAARRVVPIHKKIIPLLEKRLSNDNQVYLYENNEGNIIIPATYGVSFCKPFCKQLNIQMTPHQCRHTFITVATASGLNQILLKKIVGHSASDITQDVYTHAYIDDLIKEIDKYEL